MINNLMHLIMRMSINKLCFAEKHSCAHCKHLKNKNKGMGMHEFISYYIAFSQENMDV